MRHHRAWPALLFLYLCFEVPTSAASAQKVRLYVDNSEGDDVSVIDLKTLNPVDDIRLADKVHGLAIQADGRWLFATIESDNTLRVVDTATDKVSATIKLTGRPNLVPFGGSLLKQVVGLNSIPRDTIAVLIHIGEVVLSVRITLFRGFAVPADSLCLVRWHSFASPIDEAQRVLRHSVSLFGSFSAPACAF